MRASSVFFCFQKKSLFFFFRRLKPFDLHRTCAFTRKLKFLCFRRISNKHQLLCVYFFSIKAKVTKWFKRLVQDVLFFCIYLLAYYQSLMQFCACLWWDIARDYNNRFKGGFIASCELISNKFFILFHFLPSVVCFILHTHIDKWDAFSVHFCGCDLFQKSIEMNLNLVT